MLRKRQKECHVAALGIGHKLEILNYFVCVGMGAAATTLVGQSLGDGNRVRALRSGWRCLYLTILPVGAVTAVLVLFPRQAVASFVADEAVVVRDEMSKLDDENPPALSAASARNCLP